MGDHGSAIGSANVVGKMSRAERKCFQDVSGKMLKIRDIAVLLERILTMRWANMLFGDVLRCCLFSIEAAASGSWCPRRKENEELRHQLKQVPSNSIDFQCVLPHVCRKQTWLRLQNNRRHNSSTTAQHPHAAMNWLVDSKIQEVQSIAFRSVSLFAGESGRRHA